MDVAGILQDNAEYEVLEALTQNGYLEGAALGIARQVLFQGKDSLTSRQRYVWGKQVASYFNLECSRCHIPMPTEEVPIALIEQDGHCSWCRHQLGKDD